MSRHYALPTKKRSFIGTVAMVIKIGMLLLVSVLILLALPEMLTLPGPILGRSPAPRPDAPLVGLIAGHWQNDSGAVCPDGLEEVELTLQIARRVAHILRQQGYRAEVLPEFSPRLDGYQADVLLSIHADSCVDLSGFKVARMTQSAKPELEDRLVEALYASYAAATGIEPHPNTITEHMRQYHAFRQISRHTPGAIIECGFLGGDRELLTHGQDRVATGIADGLVAFLRQERATLSSAP
jgi:N-acetylmuramoyl-L-alanine amidase